MKIGIIIYSQTGNTHSVGLKLKEKLSAVGHSVDLERLKVLGKLRRGDKRYPVRNASQRRAINQTSF